ncbi:MAG: DUF1553 domain-containing protein, partial [Bacteroidota bacterium]
LQFFIDGRQPEFVLHADNLQKSLLHGVKGSNWSSFPLMLGREKERTIENFVMDELKVYNRALSEMEVQLLFDGKGTNNPTEQQQLEWYLVSGKNTDYNQKQQQLTQLRAEENLLATDVLEVMVMKDRRQPRPTFVLDRGMYDAKGERVQANIPAWFAASSTANEKLNVAPQNRLSLANWLVDPKHPLTARVQVNRLWMMLFGKGLVATQEDFGSQGNLPTHPELLDFLAVDFVEQGWDTKAFLKKILCSATYRQSSVPTEKAKVKDPTNQYYSHFPAYRLSAEMIRDNALAASGLLVRTIGGPSVYPYQPKGIWKALATRNATEYKQGAGEQLYRRSLYTVWKRSAPPPSMMNFDAPDRYYCIVSRQKTSTPLQSLVLMNDPQFVEAARMLGERSMKQAGPESSERIDYLFQSLVGRRATSSELKTLKQLFEQEQADFRQMPQRANALLSTGEHPVDEKLNKSELAAYTMVATTVMNFDEFVMKR